MRGFLWDPPTVPHITTLHGSHTFGGVWPPYFTRWKTHW